MRALSKPAAAHHIPAMHYPYSMGGKRQLTLVGKGT